MEVSVLRWPADAERRRVLAHAGQPRLLLVDPDARPPVSEDCLEDWIRVPAREEDVQTRIDGLRHRYRQHQSSLPLLDPDGVLRFADRWVSLPPVEARLMSALVERFGTVVGRDQLARAGWPDGAPGRNALDVHVLRLRRRIEPLGLVIKTVRSRGYLLEAAAVMAELVVPGRRHA
jgi:DNA-binding response OmpR family regulator